MDFSYGEDLEAIRQTAREVAEREVAPFAAAFDREERFPEAPMRRFAELGFLGMLIPEEHGGMNLGNLALAVVLEEINRACASTGVTLSVHNSLLGSPIVRFGNEEQKRRYLPRVASGEILGAYALTEPNAGSDAGAMRTRAERRGDRFVLNGTKIWITSGDRAGLVVVYAKTDPAAPRGKGISAFLVEPSFRGFRAGKKESKTGIRGSSTVELLFEDCEVPEANLLGTLHEGFKIAMDTLDGGRIGIGAQAVGIGRACLEASIKYAKERVQFGQPIANFQAIQFKVADMGTELDAARLLVHRAAWLRDRGARCTREAAMAKSFASRACNRAADEAVQIHGGAGYTTEFPVERYLRDARITEIYEGVTDIQRIVIARALLQ
ncbi:MAG TPA: acyl-CoA dehydrogenase family protein [Planctomycetota bacterium]|nr:acyl-CoA dehydrogenase family protein [Planctomycetota bacterium]